MPNIKNQFFRQEFIHSLLGVSKLHLTKAELLDRLNEKLKDHDLLPVHWKTLNNDITALKEQGAEIHTPNRADPCYYYLDTFYPPGTHFDDEDIDILHRGIQILKRISGFRVARDIEEMLKKMKYTRYAEGTVGNFIAFEDHTLAAGTEWLDRLAEYIHWKNTVKVNYHPFDQSPETFLFHPYYLKEYRNRWFVLGLHQLRGCLYTLALDRIKKITLTDDPHIENNILDPDSFFQDIIGVTKPDGAMPEMIKIIVFRDSAAHVETKKIHHSQKLINKNKDGSIEIELKVIINYELISTLLGFGSAVKVVAPEGLVVKIKEELTKSINRY